MRTSNPRLKRTVAITIAAASAAIAGLALTAAPAQAVAPAPAPVTPAISNPQIIAQARAELRSRVIGLHTGTTGCATAVKGLTLRCDWVALTRAPGSQAQLTTTAPVGFGATELESAYGLTTAPSTTGTIVVIDAGPDPQLENDLAVYRTQYRLPPCTVADGCFKQETYRGGAPYRSAGTGSFQGIPLTFFAELSAEETSLDVDMAAAACPKCKITEIQTPLLDVIGTDGTPAGVITSARHFATAVQLAHSQNAAAVSISYGFPSSATIDGGTIARDMSVPGTAVYASTGDSGYNRAQFGGETWPADLSTSVAAGGTSLYTGQATATGFAETAWSGGGSGCALNVGPANGQPATIAADCNGKRAASDMSAVADPNTGVAIYDTYAPYTLSPNEWVTVGGTSASSPFLAGMNVRAGVNPAADGPAVLYQAPAAAFNDVTLGSNARPGLCQSEGYAEAVCYSGTGWDGPTGLGSPRGLAPFYTY